MEREPAHKLEFHRIVIFLSSHLSAFIRTFAALLRAHFAVVDIVSFTFLGARIADACAQIAKLLCKLTVHRHKRRRSPADGSALSIDLCTRSHHLYVRFPQVWSGTELTCFCTAHACIYAALPFRILKASTAATGW